MGCKWFSCLAQDISLFIRFKSRKYSTSEAPYPGPTLGQGILHLCFLFRWTLWSSVTSLVKKTDPGSLPQKWQTEQSLEPRKPSLKIHTPPRESGSCWKIAWKDGLIRASINVWDMETDPLPLCFPSRRLLCLGLFPWADAQDLGCWVYAEALCPCGRGSTGTVHTIWGALLHLMSAQLCSVSRHAAPVTQGLGAVVLALVGECTPGSPASQAVPVFLVVRALGALQ